MIILGVDPGLAATGWGLIEATGRRSVNIAHGAILTDAAEPIELRIMTIYCQLDSIINKYQPTGAAIETLYFSRNSSSAMPVAHARGAILLLMSQHSLKIRAFTPNTIKQSVTGSGGSGKKDVQRMVQLILSLDGMPQPSHAADALAAALCYANGANSSSTA